MKVLVDASILALVASVVLSRVLAFLPKVSSPICLKLLREIAISQNDGISAENTWGWGGGRRPLSCRGQALYSMHKPCLDKNLASMIM